MENQKNGEYEFSLRAESFWIKIKFTVDANDNVNYEESLLES